MKSEEFVLNTEGAWKEGPIEVWFEMVAGHVESLKAGEHNPESSHITEDGLLWDFVRFVYERSTEPCIHSMCDALFELSSLPRTKWYA